MFIPAVVAVLMPVLAAVPVTARPRPQLVLVVNQDVKPPLTVDTLRRIGLEIAEIWRPYVDVALQPAAILEPYRGDDSLHLVLTDRQSNGRTGQGLGWIDFVDGEPSKTITVSVTGARALATRGRWAGRELSAWPAGLTETFLVRALGRAVAHEVGHYLLRSKAHTARGLMRPTFTVAEIMNRGFEQYRLQPSEVVRLGARQNSLTQNSEFRMPNFYSFPSSPTPGNSGNAASDDGDSSPSFRYVSSLSRVSLMSRFLIVS
jgi:hypothetical protein